MYNNFSVNGRLKRNYMSIHCSMSEHIFNKTIEVKTKKSSKKTQNKSIYSIKH